jgi:outer membrane protein OmpA-like peptidoglycan-associated protein
MKTTGLLIMIACIALLSACGTTVTSELAGARQAYLKASEGPAAQLSPAELHKAQVALNQAEEAFKDDAKSYRARDLAYVAQRKAEMAEAHASISAEQARVLASNKELQSSQSELLRVSKEDLNRTRSELAMSELSGQHAADQRDSALKAHLAAEQSAADAQEALAKLIATREDDQGRVYILSGGLLFRSREAGLMPGAEAQLDRLIAALAATPDRNIVVEGHTDSQEGSEAHNMELSQRRAESVRNYLVYKGFPAAQVRAMGFGERRPIADNTTIEGRSNNRRVEVVLEREVTSR